jgi:hypothetical protein
VSGTQVTSPAPRDAWNELLATDPNAMVSQTPAWSDAIQQATGAVDVSRFYVLEDGRQLLLPLLRRRPVPGLHLDDSYPLPWGYGDLLATGGVRPTDVQHVLTDLLQQRHAARTRLLANYATAAQWQAGRVPGVLCRPGTAHVLDLDGGFGRIWDQRLHKSVRTAVRKAEKSGVTIQRSTSGELTSVFYDVYLAWVLDRARDSGMPPWLATLAARRREPLRVFEAVATHLGKACRQWVAWHGGQPVAVSISLVHGGHATMWRGYGRKALAGPVRAANLLDKVAIQDACDAGCRQFSFGQSGGVVGLERYKEAFGATPRPTGDYRIERLPLSRLQAARHRAEAAAVDLLTSRRRRVNGKPPRD